MKTKIIIVTAISSILLSIMYSCNDDFLDKIPQSSISPEKYFNEESHLVSYVNGLYPSILPSGTYLTNDAHTDNQAASGFSSKYVPGEWKVPQTDASNWNFNNIYNLNYFFDMVLPKYEAGNIKGAADRIKYCIGEAYFLRAYEYFRRYQLFGDFPIVTEPLLDDLEILIEASKRSPRNEVARFILSDLDKAIELMENTIDNGKTRINKRSALLLKSRVALYEGTFLKYFKGTAFVPGSEDWAGASKDYNKNYTYPSGSIDAEINYFLDQAISTSKILADAVTLTENTGSVRQSVSEEENPYMDMYANLNPSVYDEVLLWREYNRGLEVVHGMPACAQYGNFLVGTTRGFVESFLMENGLPIYAEGSGYIGDDYINDIRKKRDSRLTLFLKEPGQKNLLINAELLYADAQPVEQYPSILGGESRSYNTGYALRKYNSWDGDQLATGRSTGSYTGLVVFRGVEALLNYIEAYYERNGSLDEVATNYWKRIRIRAKVDPDFNKTVAATDMSKEALNDWGAYSADQLIDPVLYNIRRERRCEFIGEGMRMMDLIRWRALDQMITIPYHIEGFKLWGPMQEWYKNEDGSSKLVYGLDNKGAVVSPQERSEYLRPYEKTRGSLVLNGYRWKMAHYLTPIALQNVLITSQNNDISTSPIYQNPGWTLNVGDGAVF